MKAGGSVHFVPLSDGALETYRETVTERLQRSYIRYQAMHADTAALLAHKRVKALLAAVRRSPETACVSAIVVDEKECGTLAYTISKDDDHLFLWDIHVDEHQRRSGHGRASMRHLEQIARDVPVHSIRLNVEAGNTVSEAFYRALGYLPVSVAMTKPV